MAYFMGPAIRVKSSLKQPSYSQAPRNFYAHGVYKFIHLVIGKELPFGKGML